MAKQEPRTKKTGANVNHFIQSIPDAAKREDCLKLVKMMQEATGEVSAMWGDSIVGFGSFHYIYATGHQGDWPLVGFSPRKQRLTLYIMPGVDKYKTLLNKLGKHKTGKACLYINTLADVDMAVLKELVKRSTDEMRKKKSGVSKA